MLIADDQAVRNYLIVSDLHLRGGWNNPTKGLYHFDEEFADFLRYYRIHRGGAGRQARSNDRPWTLVIGGDFIEFLYITDAPTASDKLLQDIPISEEERVYGLESEAPKARWKLDVILRSSHPQLLIALARFLAEGNDIVVLRGNHDVETFWPEVQEHFRRLIAEHHPADVGYMDMKRLVAERVRFVEWFYLVPGRLYVEHGCQYDRFCSFEYFLNPVQPEEPERIEPAISELAIRYFTNQMKLVNAMAAENIKSVSQYVGWIFRANRSALPRIVALYVGMIRRVLRDTGPHDRTAEGRVKARHDERVAATDHAFGLEPGTAAKIDRLHEKPIMRSRLATMQFLALDLWAAGFFLAFAALAVLVWYPAKLAALVVLGAAAAIGLLIYAGSIRLAGITEAQQLHGIAETIAELAGVTEIVFGHSHSAGVWPLASGGRYLNVGTWVPVAEKAFFVYAVLDTAEPGARAELMRWNKERAEPEPMTAAGPDEPGHPRMAAA